MHCGVGKSEWNYQTTVGKSYVWVKQNLGFTRALKGQDRSYFELLAQQNQQVRQPLVSRNVAGRRTISVALDTSVWRGSEQEESLTHT